MEAKTIKEVLIAARWILENVGWTQGASGRNKNRHALIYGDIKGATCFCLSGAIGAVDTSSRMQVNATKFLYQFMGSDNVVSWNDDPSRLKEDVLAVLDKAIAARK